MLDTMPRNPAILKTVLVTLSVGGVVLIPVIRDPALDKGDKLTLLTRFYDKVVSPQVPAHTFRDMVGVARTVTSLEKAWLREHTFVAAHAATDKLLLVSLAAIVTALHRLKFPARVVDCLRGILKREWTGQDNHPAYKDHKFPMTTHAHGKDWKALGFGGKSTPLALAENSPEWRELKGEVGKVGGVGVGTK